MSDLVEQLDLMAGMLAMGEKISFGTDAALMQAAADRIKELEARVERLTEVLDERSYESGLYARRMEQAQAKRDEARAQAARLREALQAMFDEYEGVYDMAIPTQHQSDKAMLAEALARAALAALPKEDS